MDAATPGELVCQVHENFAGRIRDENAAVNHEVKISEPAMAEDVRKRFPGSSAA